MATTTRAAIPRIALLIGVAGLVPFLLGTTAVLLASEQSFLSVWGASALIAWGACTLSALGAVHWGYAMRVPAPAARDLVIAAAAPLLAWMALAFGGFWGLVAMAGGFLAFQAWDQREAAAGRLPPWYPRLRLPLTGVAVACLCIVALRQG